MLYARREELDDTGRAVVAQLASFAATNFWHGMGENNRGGLIAQAMNRDTGGKALPGQAKPQKAENDPKPEEGFVRPPEDEAAADEPAGTEPASDA